MRQHVLKTFLYRPVWLPVAITAAMLILALMLLVTNAWRGIERLQPVHSHLDRILQLQETTQHLQSILFDHLLKKDTIPAAAIGGIRGDINTIVANMDAQNEPVVIASLQKAQQVLKNKPELKNEGIIEALNNLNSALKTENAAHDALLGQAKKTAEFEFSVATATLIVLPAFVMIILFMVRKRILRPINSIAWLMSQLARRETPSSPASITTEIDPMLKPLVDHYNDMVQRLAQLEDEHKIRQETLESQVRSAATSLLDQQRSLAKAEQLAATGELAARLAHELRNPLAGMQMAITNLQQEVEDIEHIERLDLVARELERITALLNGLLDQARLYPEPLRTVRLTTVVQELLALARYQLPEHIGLKQQVPEELEWRLPENELRRSLLNLVLNACQAIGERRGVIRVSIYAEDGHLLIDVCDDGPGFQQSLLESGVRSFQTTRVNGTGLGLSSVQRFARELHGTLQLHNHQPHGACVTLRIPPVGEKHV